MKLVKGYLGPDFQMEGNLSSSDSIRIDGTYIGMVSSEHSVTVGALGKVKGSSDLTTVLVLNPKLPLLTDYIGPQKLK